MNPIESAMEGMNLLDDIKDKLTTPLLQKLSGFLNETPDDVTVAMNAALPTMLGGVIQKSADPAGAGKLLDIIKDGGHTGDILNDLPTLLSNSDKTQLLMSIGGNIFNHFLGLNAHNFADRVASLSGIRKSSATSLLGLSAPLVLGIIGRRVHQDSLNDEGLIKLLNSQREVVSNSLSPSLMGFLKLDKSEPVAVTTPVAEPPPAPVAPEPVRQSEGVMSRLLPWLFLIVLGVLSAYYLRSCQLNKGKTNGTMTAADSLRMELEQSTRMSDSLAQINQSQQEAMQAGSATRQEEKQAPAEKEEKPEVKKEEAAPAKTDTKKVEQRVEKAPLPKTSGSSNRNSGSDNRSDSGSSTEASSSLSISRLKNTSGWLGFSSDNFRSGNSAELKGGSTDMKALLTYLRQYPSAQLHLAPTSGTRLAEDRAYAIKDKLIQSGIDDSRVQIDNRRSGSGAVVVRVSNR